MRAAEPGHLFPQLGYDVVDDETKCWHAKIYNISDDWLNKHGTDMDRESENHDGNTDQ